MPPPSPSTPSESSGSAKRPGFDHVDRVLLETARQLGSSLEPEAIFTRLLNSVRDAMPCDGLIVSSFDRAEHEIRCAYAWVGGNLLDPATLPALKYRPDSHGMQTEVIRTGKPKLFSDVAERVRDPKGTYYEVNKSGDVRSLRGGGPPASHSAIMVPLLLEGEVVGVVQVMADAEGVYTSAELELLEGISLLLAVALENAKLYAQAQDEIEERRRAQHELHVTEEALRVADRRKDEFIATLGHELRNPLNPILFAVELLRRKENQDPDVRWSHDVIQRQVVHIRRLIDDLLDVSRITRGKLELRRGVVEMNETLAGVVAAIQPLIDAGGQRLTLHRCDERVLVDADPMRLAQVFSNLLDNASKYSAANGRIEVTVERRGPDTVVSIQDDGSGIPAEHLPHLFDLFYQADRKLEHTQGGLGIGLTLVKQLIELHGGSIEATSAGPGHGSTFQVRLPLREDAKDAEPRENRAQALQPVRIVVADDNHDSADSMAMLLRIGGHDVRTAYDGEEVVSIADTFRPEVLLLDIGMPRLNGYEVAEQLRARSWGRDVIMIAVTGWGQDEDRRRSTAHGFDAHLVKPIDQEALTRVLSELRGSRSPA